MLGLGIWLQIGTGLGLDGSSNVQFWWYGSIHAVWCKNQRNPQTVLFLWRYELVRRTGKSDDWLTIFAAFGRIIRLTVQKLPLFWVILIEISIACWLLSRPNLRIVSKLTTDIVTYRYCTEASNQKSKYAYRKIFFYKKSTAPKYRTYNG